MKRMYISEIKCGVAEGGFACGPIDGPVVAEVKVRTENEEFYLSLAEFAGYPNFYKTENSIYELHMKSDITDDEIEFCNQHFIETGLYDELFETQKDEPLFELYRYLIYVVRASYEETDRFIEETKEKFLEDIEVPMSDVEEEYWMEKEDFDENDEE